MRPANAGVRQLSARAGAFPESLASIDIVTLNRSEAGAGDAFAATFTVYEALGGPHAVALKAASVNAASVVEHVDTQTGLLRRDALEARVEAAGDKLAVRGWKLDGVG